jgi:isoamylase
MDQLTVDRTFKAAAKISAPGASWDPDRNGVHFNLFSANAGRVQLCLFDKNGKETQVDLQKDKDGMWYGFAPDIKPGQAYGYRVHGPYDPANGKRFNPHKLLLDPYAKEMTGKLVWRQEIFGYNWGGSANDPNNMNTADSAPFVPKAVVKGPSLYDWKNTKRPETPWPKSVIYEAHVKGFSKLNEDVPQEQRGTYAGMGAKASIDHFRNLGVTAVELMPIHEIKDRADLDAQADKGLTNYWGYNTLNFFTPHRAYKSGQGEHEFQDMVRNMHEAGLEVLLDVVYNHTCEGNENGPTLSFRGIDNETYYALVPGNKSQYINDAGTGNIMNANHPVVTKLITDSMRHWIDEYHIDGFRFDLLATLGHDPATNFAFNREAPVYQAIRNVAQGRDAMTGKNIPGAPTIKISGEPWDIATYQLGNMPSGFYEWSDKFKKGVREYWLRGSASSSLASGLAGSSETFNNDNKYKGRKLKIQPTDSADIRGKKSNPYFWPRVNQGVNDLGTHDGFTLRDAVSYNSKHNEANCENNRDGGPDISTNFGHEGPTQDVSINNQRLKTMFNLVGTACLSHGPILIRMGDEMAQSQQGNNNAYCQDNEISWLDWKNMKSGVGKTMVGFWKHMLDLRQSVTVLGRHMFPHGLRIGRDYGQKDLTWFSAAGHERRECEWSDTGIFAQMLDNGAFRTNARAKLSPVTKDSRILSIFNAQSNWVPVKLPSPPGNGVWQCIANTSLPTPHSGEHELSRHAPGSEYIMAPGSMAVFVQTPDKAAPQAKPA